MPADLSRRDLTPANSARETLERVSAGWGRWLPLLDATRSSLHQLAWAPRRVDVVGGAATPLLADAVVGVAPAATAAFVRRVLAAAATAGEGPASTLRAAARHPELDALALLEAAVRQDAAGLEDRARRLAAEPDTLRFVLGLAAQPLLHACRRALASGLPPAPVARGCPVCGAWPAFAEARGPGGHLRLRCGRCGAGWVGDWLGCPYCANADPMRLGALVGGDAADTGRVETCQACHGYLKTLTVLRPTPDEDLLLVDLASSDLDVAALAHGYARPLEPAAPLRTRLVAA
jgi:FdhE protein